MLDMKVVVIDPTRTSLPFSPDLKCKHYAIMTNDAKSIVEWTRDMQISCIRGLNNSPNWLLFDRPYQYVMYLEVKPSDRLTLKLFLGK